MNSYVNSIKANGYAISETVISATAVDRLRTSMSELPDVEAVRKKTNVYGVRNLLQLSDAVRDLAGSSDIRRFIEPILGTDAFAVRATFFDKVPDANWNLRYHQDSVISVQRRVDTEGFHAWAMKGDVQQVRPPVEVLQNMLAIRVHLDDCPAHNGALRVLSGTHIRRWDRDEIAGCRKQFEEVTTVIGEGGFLAMRPLLLHASSASKSPAHRRVIHIEYASCELPGELDWHLRVGATVAPNV